MEHQVIVMKSRQYLSTHHRLSIVCVLGLLSFQARLTAAEDNFHNIVAPFLKQHCFACHGAEKQESRLRFDQITGVDQSNRNLWTRVHERIAAGEMPPAGRPQPSAEEKKPMLTWIAERQRALGAGGTRRLNRRELSAVLRDVTGLAVDFSRALPGDGTVAGFDTGADGLQEASDAVAQWLRLTQRAVDGIRFLEAAPSEKIVANLRESKDPRKTLEAWKNDGLTVRGTGAPNTSRAGMGLLLEPRAVGDRDTTNIVVPISSGQQSVMRLTLVVSAFKPMSGLPNPHLWVHFGGVDLDFREITAQFDQPQRLVYEVHTGDLVVQSKGVSIHLSNKVEIPYSVAGFENEDRSNPKDPPPGGTGLFRPAFDRRSLPPEKQPAPFIVLQHIEIEPDVVVSWPPNAWQVNVGEIKDDLPSAQRLLALWMDRAWRRPMREAEQMPFLKLYEKLRGNGLSFDNALRAAFQSVLLSAPFRYQASPAHPDQIVAQYAIASRLSFMLTGAPPDAELRRLAATGKLREAAFLDAQVDRLLTLSPWERGQGEWTEGFVRPFVMQWLEMEQPITIAQDNIQKQDFRFARI